jgi:transcriptional regulator with XRE-family HTH domain
MNGTSVTTPDMQRPSACVRVDSPELGRVLRHQRRARRLTIEDLAHAAGVHPTYLSAIERGIRNPTWSKLSDLALALHMPLSSLTHEAEREARIVRITQSIARRIDAAEDA